MGLFGSRLLIVDDERGIRETLSAMLRRYGFKVTVAATVSEALDEMAKQEFDLLLCDLNIQRENDGFDVIRAMRQLYPKCVNMILTGYPSMASAVEGVQLGVDDYIAKPASPDWLLATFAEKLAKKQATPENIGAARE